MEVVHLSRKLYGKYIAPDTTVSLNISYRARSLLEKLFELSDDEMTEWIAIQQLNASIKLSQVSNLLGFSTIKKYGLCVFATQQSPVGKSCGIISFCAEYRM